MILTIAIPTYERNEILAENLRYLLPQLTDEVCLRIIDNHSTRPVAESLPALPKGAEVIRNPVNIGGNGNILRCFETCETEWIWILGDDDHVDANAVVEVLSDIKRNPQAILLNYCQTGERPSFTPTATRGIAELLKCIPKFGELLFISASVYRAPRVRAFMDFGVHYAYSCGPHVAMLLMTLRKEPEAACYLSPYAVVINERPVVENRGSLIPIALGMPTLLELPLDYREKRILARKLTEYPRLSSVVHQLMLQVLFADLKSSDARRILRSIQARIPWQWSLTRRLAGAAWMLALIFPRLSYHLLVRPFYRMMTGHESGPKKLGLNRL